MLAYTLVALLDATKALPSRLRSVTDAPVGKTAAQDVE
jgi:hypothetical protein